MLRLAKPDKLCFVWLFVILLTLVLPTKALAQWQDNPLPQGDAPPADTAATKPKAPRRLTLLPVPAFGTTPETGFFAGAVLQAVFRLSRDTADRYSTAKLKSTFTVRDQFINDLTWVITLPGRKAIWQGINSYLKFPEYYWGISPKTPLSGDGELLQASRLEMFNEFVLRLKQSSWYLGPSQRLQYLYRFSPADSGQLERDLAAGARGPGTSSGLGAALIYDSRDRLLNASPGSKLLAVRVWNFNRALGSDFAFTHLEVDARLYLPVFKTSTLALESFHQMQFGGPAPFRMLPLLGSDAHMRGYYQGRYRDNCYHSAQAELRFPIWRWLRGGAFMIAGDVAATPLAFQGVPKTSAGGGLRIVVDKREKTALRFDYAVGPGTSGFYVAFGEAF